MNWKEYRLLLSWLFWFAVLFLLTVVVYHQGYINYLLTTDTTGITAGIFYGIAFGILWNARNMAIIQRELARAHQIETLLEDGEKIPYGKTYVNNHITQLQHMYKNGKIPSHENLIEILHIRLQLPEKYTRYLNYAFPVVGLFGTLIGLSMMTNNLDVTLSGSVSAEKAAEAIAQFTSSMKTAFNTTIAGFIGSLVLSFFHLLVENGTAHLITKIAELDELYIVPDLKSQFMNKGGEIE